ncbi:LutC/YkgG family protein [Algoriphagus mannitolivorans]|uniref:LutC/YkgG family protein n=1 Tax=Algoriphagus mannitolivorans TaxID=226504 RepID=UPI0003FE8E13|nr:LUD domain-containing protein [Algoriphagus mannitolivorans]
MSSRKKILNAIRGISREEKPLPSLPDYGVSGNLEEAFSQSILGNKGEILTTLELEAWIKEQRFEKVIALAAGFEQYSNFETPSDPHELDDLNLAILEGQFGVAENGAIWLDDSQLKHRVLPFITEHLVLILEKKNLYPTLHQAYQKIGNEFSGFGLFVAGPSKTADIEQSLVIGAHGAKSLRVVLI